MRPRGKPQFPSRWREDQTGAIAVIAAVLVAALMMSAALAVDVGRIGYASRDQQGATDRAALDSVPVVAQHESASGTVVLGAVFDAATDSLEENLGAASGVAEDRVLEHVSLGTVTSGEFVEACGADFGADGNPTNEDPACTQSVSDLAVNAVQLQTASRVDYVLALGQDPGHREITRRAAAASQRLGSISAASSTVGVDGGLLNDLLAGLLGMESAEPLGLEVIGSDGVVDSSIRLGDLVRSDELTVGSVDELLSNNIDVLSLLEASADALEAGEGNGALAADLRLLASMGVGAALDDVRLGHLGETDPGILALDTSGGAGAEAQIDALDLAMAGLQLANRDSAIDLSADVLGEIPVALTVIQPPVLAAGPPGKTSEGEWRTAARTAQLKLSIELPIGEVLDGSEQAPISEKIAEYRAQLDGDTSCEQRHEIASDLADDVEELESRAPEDSALLSALGSLLEGLLDLIGDLLGGLLGGCSVTESEIEADINELEQILVDHPGDYEEALTSGDDVEQPGSEKPELTVKTGRGVSALSEITCADPVAVIADVTSGAAEIDLARTRLLDLGLLGQVVVGADEATVGSGGGELGFQGSFPTDPKSTSSTDLGLGDVVGALSFEGTELLSVPVGGVVELVSSALTPVLDGLDDALSPLLELLGVELGEVDTRILDAHCEGRSLIDDR